MIRRQFDQPSGEAERPAKKQKKERVASREKEGHRGKAASNEKGERRDRGQGGKKDAKEKKREEEELADLEKRKMVEREALSKLIDNEMDEGIEFIMEGGDRSDNRCSAAVEGGGKNEIGFPIVDNVDEDSDDDDDDIAYGIL